MSLLHVLCRMTTGSTSPLRIPVGGCSLTAPAIEQGFIRVFFRIVHARTACQGTPPATAAPQKSNPSDSTEGSPVRTSRLPFGENTRNAESDRTGLGHFFEICQPPGTLLLAHLTSGRRHDFQVQLIGMLPRIFLLDFFCLGHLFSPLALDHSSLCRRTTLFLRQAHKTEPLAVKIGTAQAGRRRHDHLTGAYAPQWLEVPP